MDDHPPELHQLCELPTGTISATRAVDPAVQKWVYQRTGHGFGNLGNRGSHDLQVRRHVIPRDPRTARQLARRAWFQRGIEMWQETTPEERASWKKAGLPRSIPAYNAFISAWQKKMPPLREAMALDIEAARIALATDVQALASAAAVSPPAAAASINTTGQALASAALLAALRAQGVGTGYGIRWGTIFYLMNLPAIPAPQSLPWAANVRNIGHATTPTVDSTTRLDWAAGAASSLKWLMPYAVSSAAGNPDAQGFGIQPGEMLSTSWSKKRIPAGNHRIIFDVRSNGFLDSSSYSARARLYRVGPAPGYTRTQLMETIGTLQMTLQSGTFNIAMNAPQITLEEGETLAYAAGITAAGNLLSAKQLTCYLGKSNVGARTQARIEYPGMTTFNV